MIVKDPVCGRDVDTDAMERPVSAIDAGAPEIDPTKGTKRFHDGQWYYFHDLACRMKFVSSPEQYLSK
jgi:YHS domain-containing protein